MQGTNPYLYYGKLNADNQAMQGAYQPYYAGQANQAGIYSQNPQIYAAPYNASAQYAPFNQEYYSEDGYSNYTLGQVYPQGYNQNPAYYPNNVQQDLGEEEVLNLRDSKYKKKGGTKYKIVNIGRPCDELEEHRVKEAKEFKIMIYTLIIECIAIGIDIVIIVDALCRGEITKAIIFGIVSVPFVRWISGQFSKLMMHYAKKGTPFEMYSQNLINAMLSDEDREEILHLDNLGGNVLKLIRDRRNS